MKTISKFTVGLFLAVCLVVSASAPVFGAEATAFEKQVGYLVSGTGQWRAPNPDYNEGSDEPQQYGMNYRWGPHKKHVIGEIVSLYDDGRINKEWSMYVTYIPVTEIAYFEQTGAKGVYFRGELSVAPNGRHAQQGIVYLPNGTMRSVRDEFERVDANTRIAHVFERDEAGGWEKKRQWVWRQVGD